jgi:photosystem II stability/assembly factor-like uncharacterized protein
MKKRSIVLFIFICVILCACNAAITPVTSVDNASPIPLKKSILSKSIGNNNLEIYETGGGIYVDYSDDNGNQVSAALPLQDQLKINDLTSDFFLPVFNVKGPSWILLHSDMALGSEEKILFVTKDKGKTWEYAGKMPSEGYVNGITFRNENEGWVGFEYYGENLVPLYRTIDGGKTWEKQIIDLPKGYRYGTVFAPSFDPNYDLKGRIEIEFARDNSDIKDTIAYQTSDGGKSWIKDDG